MLINEFGEAVVSRVMKFGKADAFKKCGGKLREDLSNIKPFVGNLLEIIMQGCSNLNLQLETPNQVLSQSNGNLRSAIPMPQYPPP